MASLFVPLQLCFPKPKFLSIALRFQLFSLFLLAPIQFFHLSLKLFFSLLHLLLKLSLHLFNCCLTFGFSPFIIYPVSLIPSLEFESTRLCILFHLHSCFLLLFGKSNSHLFQLAHSFQFLFLLLLKNSLLFICCLLACLFFVSFSLEPNTLILGKLCFSLSLSFLCPHAFLLDFKSKLSLLFFLLPYKFSLGFLLPLIFCYFALFLFFNVLFIDLSLVLRFTTATFSFAFSLLDLIIIRVFKFISK